MCACSHVCVEFVSLLDICVCWVLRTVCVAVGVGSEGVIDCNCAVVSWNGMHVECSSVWWGGLASVIGCDGDVGLAG